MSRVLFPYASSTAVFMPARSDEDTCFFSDAHLTTSQESWKGSALAQILNKKKKIFFQLLVHTLLNIHGQISFEQSTEKKAKICFLMFLIPFPFQNPVSKKKKKPLLKSLNANRNLSLYMVWSEDGEDVSGLRGEIEFISSNIPCLEP